MTSTKDITRTLPFWLMFGISTLSSTTNSASTPTIPLYVEQSLDGDTELSGLLISFAPLAAVVGMPLAGFLADRLGYRRVALAGSITSLSGLTVLALIATVWGAGFGRILHGFGNATTMSLTMTWLVSLTTPGQRGKALSLYGLSVWLGLASGPQIAAAVNAASTPRAVFALCVILELLLFTLILRLPRPPRSDVASGVDAASKPTKSRRAQGAVCGGLQAVWPAGIAAAGAWCGEGLILGFLIVHLTGRGLPATGMFGAASAFTVFAVSVVIARIILARMPDRIGPLRSAAISLVALSAGLAVLAFADSFALGAIGASLMGVGFAPLYPSLTMLAARGLQPENRALGLGIFGSFTNIGYGSGGLLGGFVLGVTSSLWAFVIVSAVQLLALVVLVVFSRDSTRGPESRRDGLQPPTV